MANTLRIKRRAAASGAGAPSTLANAELAFNEAANVLYYGTGTGGAGGSATSVIAIGGDGAYLGLSSGLTQTVAGTYTFSGGVTFSGTTELGAATATSPSASDDSTRVATTAWVQDEIAALGAGSVTSVGLSLPNIFTVTGSPVTSTGTLTASLATQTANQILAGPTTGSAAAPGFRSLVAADIPDLSATYLTSAVTSVALSLPDIFSVSGSPVTSTGTLSATFSTQTQNHVFAAPGSGGNGAPAFRALASGDIPDLSGAYLPIAGGSLTGNLTVGGDLTVSGTCTINGDTVTVNATTLTVDDKNIELGSVYSPSDATADGGGVILKGSTDHTILWVDATDAWTFSEHVNLASGKEFKINGSSVVSSSALGSGVTSSSLTTVGTLTSGTWQANTIGVGYGGTGLAAAPQGSVLVANTANTFTALDGGGSADKLLLYSAASDSISWTNEIDGGTF